MELQIVGSGEVRAHLDRMDDALRGQTLTRALVSGALIIQNAAKELAPYRTGNLRRSIHIGGRSDLAHDFENTTGGELEGPRISTNEVRVFVGTNVEYARQREYGGVIEARNAPWLVWQDYEGNWHRARRVEQAATPFMRPALDENRDAVRREVAAALRQLIGLG